MDVKDECKIKAYDSIISKIDTMAALIQNIRNTARVAQDREYTEDEKQIIANTSYRLDILAGECMGISECVNNEWLDKIV